MRPMITFKHDITLWCAALPLLLVAIIFMVVLKDSLAAGLFWGKIMFALMGWSLVLCLLEATKIIDVPRLWIGDHEVDPQPTVFFLMENKGA